MGREIVEWCSMQLLDFVFKTNEKSTKWWWKWHTRCTHIVIYLKQVDSCIPNDIPFHARSFHSKNESTIRMDFFICSWTLCDDTLRVKNISRHIARQPNRLCIEKTARGARETARNRILRFIVRLWWSWTLQCEHTQSSVRKSAIPFPFECRWLHNGANETQKW